MNDIEIQAMVNDIAVALGSIADALSNSSKDNELTIVDISDNIKKIADAVSDSEAMMGTDAAGGKVKCLTEAVMGNTAGLVAISESINNLAQAVREHG